MDSVSENSRRKQLPGLLPDAGGTQLRNEVMFEIKAAFQWHVLIGRVLVLKVIFSAIDSVSFSLNLSNYVEDFQNYVNFAKFGRRNWLLFIMFCKNQKFTFMSVPENIKEKGSDDDVMVL